MTITVTAPNGSTVQFPDGTDHATINGVMEQHFQPAETAPDKYQQAAIEEDKAVGGADAGFTRRLTHGATLGADSTIMAAAMTPLEMFKRGINPKEAYNYAKAREDLIMNKSRESTGLLGTAAEVLGGGVSGAGLANGGVTAARFLAPEAGLLARSAASAADAAALGGFSGAMEGDGIQERFNNSMKGLAAGTALGGLTPGALKIAGAALSPAISNIRARMNPQGFAESQIARGIHESGVNPDDLSLRAVQAANEGQPQFTLADAMGNAGQRMLSTVARAPGEGRTAVVNALDARQGDQGRRLAGAFQDAFDAPKTAEQTRAGMVENANFEAGRNYAPVKRETAPIDVSAPVAIANRSISPAADRLASTGSYETVPQALPTDPLEKVRAILNPPAPVYRQVPPAPPTDLAARARIEGQESALRDPIGSALKEARSYLAAPTLTASNVNQAFRAKTNIDMMIAKATENKQGALVGELIPVRDALDTALAKTSTNYAAARDAYKLAQKRIEALDLGKLTGSKPGRPEDAIRQFGALDQEAQTAFRRGYVDPQISQVQNAAFGTNKARPFTSDAIRQEFNAFAAPGRADQLQRQIGREQTMFETRNHALGGSRTADNLNDHAAMGVDPHLVSQIMTGNWHGAVRTALSAGHNVVSGNTPAVRQEVANILLQNGGNLAPAQLRRMVNETVARIQFVNNIARNVGRGAAGGLAVAVPGIQQRR